VGHLFTPPPVAHDNAHPKKLS